LENIQLLMEKIRDYVNSKSFVNIYRRDNEMNKWDELCIAMDIVDDTTLGIKEFVNNGLGESVEQKYLRLYGVLQCIYTQQDALNLLSESFGLKLNLRKYPHSIMIREFRNETIGHPTNTLRGKIIKRSYFSRISLGWTEINVVSYLNTDGLRETVIKKYKLIALIYKYIEEVERILNDVRSKQVEWYKNKMNK
jgi:hypothetical protein